jgi:Domain of unknown function (DUF4258)
MMGERNLANGILEQVQEAANKRLLFLPHTIRQMARPDRMITTNEVEEVIKTGEVIEDYPEDVRGHSCLILGFGRDNRAVHVVCAPKDEYLAIITAYVPNLDQWTPDFRRRL